MIAVRQITGGVGGCEQCLEEGGVAAEMDRRWVTCVCVCGGGVGWGVALTLSASH